MPPSSLFRLNERHVAAGMIVGLARSRERALEAMRSAAAELPIVPSSVIVFGSFARREAERDSDIDVVVVRPDQTPEDDEIWTAGVARWSETVRLVTGNVVELLEVSEAEAVAKLGGRSPLWRDIARDGHVVCGAAVDELRMAARA